MEPGRAICESAESPVHFFSVAVFLKCFCQKKILTFSFFFFFFLYIFFVLWSTPTSLRSLTRPGYWKRSFGLYRVVTGFLFHFGFIWYEPGPDHMEPIGFSSRIADFTGFYRFFSYFYRVLPSFLGFYRVLLGFT